MSIKAFEITAKNNVPLQVNASTLDEMTGALPQGFYTTFSTLAHGTRVLGLRDHLRRLYTPAQTLNLRPAVDEQSLRGRIAALVESNLPHESRVRIILTKDSGKIYIGLQSFTSLPEAVYKNGVHVITSSIARHDPRIKDTGFIAESIKQRKLLNQEIFEVLLTSNAKILEGMTSNFYAIQQRAHGNITLITARQGILLGVTRHVVLRLARGEGMKIEYRAPKIDEKFDEAFLTSSSRGIVPIILIDDHPVGQGQVGQQTKRLMKAYWEYVEKSSSKIVE